MDMSRQAPMDDIRALLVRSGLEKVTVERGSSLVTAKSAHFELTTYDDRNPSERDRASGAKPSIFCAFSFTLLPDGSETDVNSRNAWRLNIEEAEKFALGKSAGGRACLSFHELETRLTAVLAKLPATLAKYQDPAELRKALRELRFGS